MIDRIYTSERPSVQNVPAAQDIYSMMSRRVIPGVPSGTQQGSKRFDVCDNEYQWNNIAYLTARSGIVNHSKDINMMSLRLIFIYWYNCDQTIKNF